MRIYVQTELKKQTYVLNKINKFKKTKAKIFNKNTIIAVVEPFSSDQESQIKKIREKFKKITGVKNIYEGPVFKEKEELEQNVVYRDHHFFFDIDSTLTRYSTGTINRKVLKIFRELNDRGYFLYFVSGRSYPKIKADMLNYPVEEYAIAENGGLILHGTAAGSFEKHGNKEEPQKVWNYIRSRHTNITQDKKQGVRITEIVVLNKNITQKEIEDAITTIGANAQVLASKEAFHISKKGVDKGSALEKLTTDLELGDSQIIAVGDSDLDIPMFKAADLAFAPKNASSNIQQMSEVEIMSKPYFEGVIEMYEKYFKK